MRYREIIGDSRPVAFYPEQIKVVDRSIVTEGARGPYRFTAFHGTDSGQLQRTGEGYFLTTDLIGAMKSGLHVIQVNVEIDNPLWASRTTLSKPGRYSSAEMRERCRMLGFDAVLLDTRDDDDNMEIILFDPAKIKTVERVAVPVPSREAMLAKYPERLSEEELIDFAFDHAPEEDQDSNHLREWLEEMFGGYEGELRLVPIAGLTYNDGSGSSAKVRDYDAMETLPPPILVEGNEIKDGNHRVRVARLRGQTSIWAYVLTSTDEPI